MTDSVRVPGLSVDENATVNGLIKQLDAKAPRNRLRSAHYDGRKAARQIGNVIPAQYQNIGLTLGWTGKAVDGLARRCNIDEFVWADGDLKSLGMRELEDSNFLMSELSQARTDSLLHGISYLITTRGDESAGEPRALIHAKDALSATGEWNNRRRRLDNLLSVTARDGDKLNGFVLYLDNLTISAERNAGGRWSVERSPHEWGVPVDPLVYKPRVSRNLGRSRINRPIMSHTEAALRALIRLEAHMDIYAIPKLLLLGGSDEMFKNADGTPKTSYQMIMGRLLGIPDDEDATTPRADVKQLSAESPDSHISQVNTMAKLVAREADLPDSDFALSDMANPTSEGSYIQGRDNLVAEAEGATEDWSVGIRRRVACALAIQNNVSAVPKEWAGIVPSWRSPLYLSKAAAADAGAKQLGAVPWLAETEIGLELIGLDKDQRDRALSQRADAERRASGRAVLAALNPAPANVSA